ncbi:MAG: histidine phosphatase family protein [Flavobacteriales bacterium]|nr:histidine phosphatase family protein [Flavobacteriales bacterium]
MRTLYVCRHAKSSWADGSISDHDRPLNERGSRDAPLMAREFRARKEHVDLLVSSTALRAITTAQAFAHELGYDPGSIHQSTALYHADVPTLMQVITGLPGNASSVMLFGHNPGLTYLLDHLTDAGVDNLPTCGLVRIDMEIDDWQAVSRSIGTQRWYDHPKRHAGHG